MEGKPWKLTLSPLPVRLQRTLTATYLPQIAPEQGWSKLETLESAIQKAGFRGELSDIWIEGDEDDLEQARKEGRGTLTVRKYRSEKSEVSYADWVKARA